LIISLTYSTSPSFTVKLLFQNLKSLIRLAKFFGTSAKFWMGLQDDYDLEEAEKKVDLHMIERFQAAC